MDRREYPAKKKDLSKLALLKTSWKYQWKEFFNNSNLHGVRYIAEKDRPFHEKFIWLSFILVGLAVTLVIMTSLWEKFQISPTITGLDTDFYKWDVPFPAITVCPRNPIDEIAVQNYINSNWGRTLDVDTENYYREFVTRVTNLSMSNIEGLLKFEDDSSLFNVNLKDIVKKTSIKCEQMLEECTWKGDKYECCDLFYPILTDQGFCFTFNSKHFERNFSGLVVDSEVQNIEVKYIYETDNELSSIFNSPDITQNPLSVYIHSWTERIGSEFQAYHVWMGKVDRILFSSKETYTTEDTRQLSIQQRRCVFPDEITLITDDTYTFSACMIQCRMNLAKQKCGCIPFFYPEIDDYRSCNIKELACIARFVNEIEKSFNCKCELGCMNTVYKIEKLEDLKKDDPNAPLEVGFLSWPLIRYKRDVLFGWVDLFVAFGGIAGLFLGFSVLTVIETIYFFTMRACCMVHREKDKLTRLYHEYKEAEEPEIDLKLKPYFIPDHSDNKQSENVHTNVDNIFPYLP